MRVLHVINSLILAGAERLVRDLAPLQRAAGVEAEVAVLKYLDSPLEADLRQAGVLLFRTSAADMYSPAHVRPLRRVLDRYDLVHAHLFPAQLWAAAAVRWHANAPPLVITEHNTTNRRRRSWLKGMDRWMYRQFRAVACNSEASREALADWLPESAGKLRVIHNGVELRRFIDAAPARRADLGLPEGPLVISVCRLEPQKDPATLIAAMESIPDATLLMVGDGQLRGELEQQAAAAGLSSRIKFLGRRNDIPQLLKMADVFALASTWEGFGISVVEAMAAGVPVVATDVPGVAQVVGDAGMLVPIKDPGALAEAISAVLQDPKRSSAMSAAGQTRARSFDISETVAQYAELYEAVLGKAVSREQPASS